VSVPHFFAGAPEPGAAVVLEADDARHAVASLRLRVGDRFTSSDGRGALVTCRVTRADRFSVEGTVLDRTTEEPARPELSVLMAAPKGDRLAWAIQKLTEVGVDGISLVETPRSVRRWHGDRAARVSGRIEAVAGEAAKQSRRRTLPTIDGPLAWDDALGRAVGWGPTFVLWEGADRGLLTLLPDAAPERLSLAVGPEGGIPEEDALTAEARGAVLGSLGPNVLRTETAAVAGAAVALARYGRLG
jgi:16S rRNA (uracil1498-N3)-methyltransferase